MSYTMTQQHPMANGSEHVQEYATFFCRAKYDYETDDSSSLSFRKNDVIEVLGCLDSGWWDGHMGDGRRGWFPSNYVAVISDEEADRQFSALEYGVSQLNEQENGVADFANGMGRSQGGQSDHESNWLAGDRDTTMTGNVVEDFTEGATQQPQTSSDFWVPQVTQDGQIYYVNTQTGQRSRELPSETSELTESTDANGFPSASTSRTDAHAGVGSGSTLQGAGFGFGTARMNGIPEPWLKRLADDGMSYYYVNRSDGTVRWTPPEPDTAASSDDEPFVRERKMTSASASSGFSGSGTYDSGQLSTRTRTDSATSLLQRDRGYSTTSSRPLSLYSVDSDVRPKSVVDPLSNNRPTPARRAQPELTSAEKLAQSLQQALAAPPPNSIEELSTAAHQAIANVRQYAPRNEEPEDPMQREQEVGDLIQTVITAIRDLLYVTVTISGPPPYHLLLRDVRSGDTGTGAESQMLQADLKPFQRKVTATLSKLVLSARSACLDSPGDAERQDSNFSARMEQDASELERAISNFVNEVQRRLNIIQQLHPRSGRKRLKGVFQTANIGLGLLGAGSAATWRGFGWVTLESNISGPSRQLGAEAVAELRSCIAQLDNAISQLSLGLSETCDDQTELLLSQSQGILSRVALFIRSVNDINMARHVDVDDPSDSGAAVEYLKSVEKARSLIRILEATLQAIYDDCNRLLVAAQAALAFQARLDEVPSATIGFLHESLKTRMTLVIQSIEDLHTIGLQQSDSSRERHTNSISWRISRLGVVDGDFAAALTELSSTGVPRPGLLDEEDVVDMDYVFTGPPPPAKYPPESSSQDISSEVSTASQGLVQTRDRLVPDMTPRPTLDVTPWMNEPDPSSASGFDLLPNSTTERLEDQTMEEDHAGYSDEEETATSRKPRATKIEKFFGDDAPQHYVDQQKAGAQPWYLRPNYSNTEILINPDGTVRGGTLPALVERLTAHESADSSAFLKTFLLTYSSFTDLEALFDLLIQRYRIPSPDGLTAKELKEWTKLKQDIIRVRVMNIFKQMISDDDFLEKDDMYILDRIKGFITSPEVVNSAPAKALIALLERRAQSGEAPLAKRPVVAYPVNAPLSVVPKTSKGKLKLMDIDPLELARQLTIRENILFNRIRPVEYMRRSREQKPSGTGPDNIAPVIQMSNQIPNWITDAVLAPDDSRKRAGVIKHFINLADRCRALNNFSCMFAIITGLNSVPVRRLKRTWEQVSGKYMAIMASCESTIDTNKNFANYKATLAKAQPPCIPFIGLYLSVLTFIHFGSKDMLEKNLINFAKRQKVAETIREIKHWQSKGYNLNPVPSIQQYIDDSLSQYVDDKDLADQFWNLSLEREPKEREDEKMARLLQESGFL